MTTVYEFLESHPGLSISWIEKQLGLTHGTLRIGKIPEKYMEGVKTLMSEYGYDNGNTFKVTGDVKLSGDDVRIHSGEVYEMRGGVLGRIEGGLFRRASLADGTKLEVVK
jgi:hypothetical protein